MLNNTDFVKKCSVFNMIESRLDDFYMDALDPLHIDLISFVKLCLILSHGNAAVESGFSINEQLLEENMREATVISQRIVYEGLLADGGILKIEIDDVMRCYVKQSHSVYLQALEKNKKEQTEGEKKTAARKEINSVIRNLQKEKKDVLSSIVVKAASMDGQIHSLQEELRKV